MYGNNLCGGSLMSMYRYRMILLLCSSSEIVPTHAFTRNGNRLPIIEFSYVYKC